MAFDPRRFKTIEIRGSFPTVPFLFFDVLSEAIGDQYDMRHKHYGTTLMNGEEGHWNNDKSKPNCVSLTSKASFTSKMYPLSTSISFSEATMDSHAVRPHVSQSALSRTGSTITLCSGLAKAMPLTDVLEAGKPRPIHVFRSLQSIPPWWCIRPRMCHQCLRDCIRSNRLVPPSSRANG